MFNFISDDDMGRAIDQVSVIDGYEDIGTDEDQLERLLAAASSLGPNFNIRNFVLAFCLGVMTERNRIERIGNE